ncbi:MAG: CopM family metallochaperone [Psychrobacter sp.]
MAQDIIDNQQVEIAILNKWLASHPDTVKPKPNTEAMQEAYARSMDVLNGDMVLGIADPVPDMAFARGMLPHHISAVEMAKIQLEYGTNGEMRQLAKDIIDAQQAEIQLMQNWIAALEVINNEPKANNSAIDDDTNSTDNDEVQIEQPVN